MRILVVDDEDSFRFAVRSALDSYTDYEITDCESGEEALEALKSRPFDIILLDYKMSGVSGLNVLQTMHEQKMETPVIMLTAAGTETVAVEAMKLGAYDYIRKEHVDIQHLPIVINGVHERYLFRKEKREREIRQESAHISEAMVNAISEIMTNALTIVSMYLREFEERLKPSVVPEAQEHFTKSLNEIHQEFAVLASGLKSIVEISKEAETAEQVSNLEHASRQTEKLGR